MHALHQAILDSEDDAERAVAWAVLADHLQTSGDQRGQLWALDQALDERAGPGDPRLALIRQRNRIHGAHVGTWLGPLIAELDRDSAHPGAYGSEVAALQKQQISWSQLRFLPRLFHRQEPSVQLAWRAGFVTAARIRGPDDRVNALAAALFSCPATPLLTCLDITCDGLDAGTRSLHSGARPAGLRCLRLRTTTPGAWSLGWLSGAAPRLRRLSVDDGDFSGFSHDTLHTLQCTGQRADRALGSLSSAALPVLERLLVGAFTGIGEHVDLSDLGDAQRMPALHTLRLARMRPEIEEPLCAALLQSPLMSRISRLEIEWLNDRPDTRSWLDAHRATSTRARVFDIREYSELFCKGL